MITGVNQKYAIIKDKGSRGSNRGIKVSQEKSGGKDFPDSGNGLLSPWCYE